MTSTRRGRGQAHEVWLLRTGFGIAPVNKLVSLTWLLWALRSFRSFTLHNITCGRRGGGEVRADTHAENFEIYDLLLIVEQYTLNQTKEFWIDNVLAIIAKKQFFVQRDVGHVNEFVPQLDLWNSFYNSSLKRSAKNLGISSESNVCNSTWNVVLALNCCSALIEVVAITTMIYIFDQVVVEAFGQMMCKYSATVCFVLFCSWWGWGNINKGGSGANCRCNGFHWACHCILYSNSINHSVNQSFNQSFN